MELTIYGRELSHFLTVHVGYYVGEGLYYARVDEAHWPTGAEALHKAGVMGPIGVPGVTIQAAVDLLLQRVLEIPG